MEVKGFKGKLFVLFDWITRLAYVNVLWIGCSLLGLLIAGFFPATSAMYALIRRWVRGNADFSVHRLFWQTFKEDFKRANAFGWVLTLIGIVLYVDYLYFTSSSSTIFFLLKSFTIMLLFVYVLMAVMIFPVFVHYKLTLVQLFRNTIFIAMLHPFKSFAAILGVGAISLVMYLMPTLIPFFGGSLIALYVTWISQPMFRKIDERQQDAVKNE
ncbi:YesL family protein [Pseudalkalibacillus sp. SCS-8]|uniref:YesL family protein n=1 Tax=Pseudalkalibacillus nanhaiensis TaxID=3115291 RepID=UPI0032DAEFE9